PGPHAETGARPGLHAAGLGVHPRRPRAPVARGAARGETTADGPARRRAGPPHRPRRTVHELCGDRALTPAPTRAPNDAPSPTRGKRRFPRSFVYRSLAKAQNWAMATLLKTPIQM